MNRKHPTAVKRVVFVTIAGLEQIEMFEQRDKNSSKTIKEDIKLQISNMLDIPAAKIIDFSLDTLMFNIVSYFNDEELIKILQIQSPLIHSKFETTFLIGMASYNDDRDLVLAQKKAFYNLQINRTNQLLRSNIHISNSFEHAIRRYELELLIPDAIQKNEFSVVYQPIIDSDKQIVGAEALLRWRHGKEQISPEIFIPIAERSTLIQQLSFIVIEEAFQTLKANRDLNYISVNLSPFTLDSIQWLLTYLASYSVSDQPYVSKIVWEITEVKKLTPAAWESITKLKQRGHKIFIDDFGEGHTSFSYLLSSIDAVKIDKKFIRDKVTSLQNDYYISAVINLCKDLHLDVILEGIESQAELEKFTIFKSKFQGFHISIPLNKEALNIFIKDFQEA